MIRMFVLGAGSVATLIALNTPASAQVFGGGASAVANDLGNNGLAVVTTPGTELGTFGNFVYQKSSAGAGRNAVLTNNEQCNVSNIAFPLACGGSLSDTVAYGNSDGPLTSAEIAFAATQSAPAVNAVYGNLIQIPFLGNAVAIPVINSKVTKDGGVVLKDSDLCGIFSGKIQNWNQTTAASHLTAGQIQVAFRQDSSGASFLFDNHLAAKDTKIAVCTAGNTDPNVTFSPTSNFVDQFPTTSNVLDTQAVVDASGVTHFVPANFHPETGSSAVAAYLVTQTSAVGYITPDYTHIVTHTGTLFDAALNKAGNIPNTNKIAIGLQSVTTTNPLNINQTPPTAATANDPTKWVPIVSTVKVGYSIVGYSNIVFPQCFSSANASVAANLASFLNAHYNDEPTYEPIQDKNGFVPLSDILGQKYFTAINSLILNASAATGLQSTTGCSSFAGR